MRSEDLPATCIAAKGAAARAQALHYRVLGIHLTALVLVAVLAAWSGGASGVGRIVQYVAAASMLIALAMGVISRRGALGNEWFACRAVAEHLKNLTWRFATRTMRGERAEGHAEGVFSAQLASITRRFPDARAAIARDLRVGAPEVTERMRELRAASVATRAQVLSQKRILDQIDWYGRKAEWNHKQEGRWQTLVVGTECLAALCALLQFWHHSWIGVTSSLAALASVGIAWSQSRRHAELGQRYARAQHDLQAAYDEHGDVDTVEDLRALVEATESALAREHGMWLIRAGQEGGIL